jgi:hypothetical protein
MTTVNQARYRLVGYEGERIVEARELLAAQYYALGINPNDQSKTSYGLDALYVDGALFNVTPSITGLTVTLTATNSSLPMYVFVRGVWETFISGETPAITFSSGGGTLYLNWSLDIITSVDDPTLVDVGTSEPTANAGQMDLIISATDTSGVSIDNSTQYAKNTVPIVLYVLTPSSSTLIPTKPDNVNPLAWASLGITGLVSLSTNTSDGEACASDDPRLSNTRTPTAGTVVDASVRVPQPYGAGTTYNADGSLQYVIGTGAGDDPGGIDAAKIVFQSGKQLLTATIGLAQSAISHINSLLAAHLGAPLSPLGSSSVLPHPMPTSSQVGAAPLSHVSLPFAVAGSHPPTTSSNTTGFTVNRATSPAGTSTQFGYCIIENGSIYINGLTHSGDIYSNLAHVLGTDLIIPTWGWGTNPLGGALTTGSMDLYSILAQVVYQHVIQQGTNNPHNLTQNFTFSSGAEGYIQLPVWLGGFIIQWGLHSSAGGGGVPVSYSIPFPHAVFAVIPNPTGTTSSNYAWTNGVNTSGFSLIDNGTSASCYWIAIGY